MIKNNILHSIFEEKIKYWLEQNVSFFGIMPREWETLSMQEIQSFLDADFEKYWLDEENRCELFRLMKDGVLLKNESSMINNKWSIEMNIISECIEVYANFEYKDRQFKRLAVVFPAPHKNLSWVINRTQYVPRIVCKRDYSLLNKKDENTVQCNRLWEYNIETEQFNIPKIKGKSIDPFEDLSMKNKLYLESLINEELTKKNFKEALKLVRETHYQSVFNQNYYHIDHFFDMIRNTKLYANPFTSIPLAINAMFMKSAKSNSNNDTSDLVISKSKLFAFESFNTVVYEGQKYDSFSFQDSKLFFDAFKTSTNSKSAGHHRLLLDNIKVKDGMLWLDLDGEYISMFHLYNNPELQKKSISCVSSSLFCYNNDPKRIMMTAKLSAQSVPVVGEYDSFTNRIKARVVFCDYMSFSYADSVIVSESFAKRLDTYQRQYILLDSTEEPETFQHIVDKLLKSDFKLTLEDLQMLFPKTNVLQLKNYTNAVVEKWDKRSDTILKLQVYMELQFMKGDKLTNLHGAKGVSGLILSDNQMPILKNDISEDFKAGPVDIIISGYSALRRGSLGQIFEAWANTSGIDFDFGEDLISSAITKYSKEMKEFSEKSVFEFGEFGESIKPCGIIDIIRLHHHAPTKASRSFLKTNNNRMLKLGEMEKLSLAANGCYNVLTELSLRSTRKHNNPFTKINHLIETGEMPEELDPKLNFAVLLKSMGLEMMVDGESLIPSLDEDLNLLNNNMSILDDEEIIF